MWRKAKGRRDRASVRSPYAASFRYLAALLRSGLPLRQALLRWPREVEPPLAAEVERIAARIRLGASSISALTGTRVEPMLTTAFTLHLSSGIDLAGWLEHRAATLDERDAFAQAARAASSGAILSGRMVAGLPLLFVPLVPATRAPMLDLPGVALLIVGILLSYAGLRWIGRLVPSTPPEDRVASFCNSAAALLDAGLSLASALEVAAAEAGIASSEDAARSLVRLGWSWPAALAEVDAAFASLGRALEDARRFGLPAAGSLRSVERARTAQATREFDRRVRRAPVLMVVPLTCCVLPAYGLLGLAPFLRGMSMA